MGSKELSKELKKTTKVFSLEVTSSNPLFVRSIFLLFLLSAILIRSIKCDGKFGLPEIKERDQIEKSQVVTSSRRAKREELALPLRLSKSGPQKITIGAILPATALTTIKRAYNKRFQDTVEGITKGKDVKFNFTSEYFLAHAKVVLVSLNPSPNEVLSTLCNHLLPSNITSVIYMTNSDVYVQNTASAQYLMQLTGYLGIPMIAWNADNIGLEQVSLIFCFSPET